MATVTIPLAGGISEGLYLFLLQLENRMRGRGRSMPPELGVVKLLDRYVDRESQVFVLDYESAVGFAELLAIPGVSSTSALHALADHVMDHPVNVPTVVACVLTVDSWGPRAARTVRMMDRTGSLTGLRREFAGGPATVLGSDAEGPLTAALRGLVSVLR